MNDRDFDDLFGEEEMLLDWSQESLTISAANLQFDDDNDRDQAMASLGSTPGTSQDPAENPGDQDSTNSVLDLIAVKPTGTCSVIEQIAAVFERIADGLISESNQVSIQLKTRLTAATPRTKNAASAHMRTKEICFPGRTARDAWRFTVVLRILELMHEALRTDVVLSKRDIYYRDPALFGNQTAVDRYVDDIAFTFDFPRSKLNVTAAAKGLVAGAFRFCRRDGSIVDAAGDSDGMLVPPLRDILSVDLTAITWILVVEKEATFRSIASSTFWNSISTHGVIITGKGYPDIATRALLHFLSTPSPQNGFGSPPVFGLADCDPDGLAILSIYRHGSTAMAHENDSLCVPHLCWLGLRVEHMMDESLLHNSQGLLSFTARDRRKATKMLERCVDSEDDEESQMCGALQSMLMLNTKAELQLLDAVPNGMTSLLESALGRL